MSKKDDDYIPFNDFETLAECKERLAKRIKKLKAAGSDYDDIRHQLEGHADDDWSCKHPICPICLRSQRAKFIKNAARMIRREWSTMNGELGYLTYIPAETLPSGKLGELDLRDFKDLLAKHINRAGLRNVLLVGGVDISFNVQQSLLSEEYWQPHLHAVGHFPEGRKRSSEMLSGYLGKYRSAYRPILIKPLSVRAGLKAALGYCIKPYFDRREHYLDSFGEPSISKYPLKDGELLESIRFLDLWSANARVFTKGVKRKGLLFETDAKSVGNSKTEADELAHKRSS